MLSVGFAASAKRWAAVRPARPGRAANMEAHMTKLKTTAALAALVLAASAGIASAQTRVQAGPGWQGPGYNNYYDREYWDAVTTAPGPFVGPYSSYNNYYNSDYWNAIRGW
jgi:hypothetical protein